MISLRTGSGSLIENPTSADISAALTALHSVKEVLTVSDGDGLSLEAVRAPEGKFRIEYRDSSAGERYTARTHALAYSTVLRLFCLFPEQNPDWRTVIKWKQRAKPLEQPELSRVHIIGCLAAALLIQMLIVGAVYYGLESGSGFVVRVRALPLLLLMAIPVGLVAGLLTPFGLSEAAAVAVAVALLFLVLDIAALILLRLLRSVG